MLKQFFLLLRGFFIFLLVVMGVVTIYVCLLPINERHMLFSVAKSGFRAVTAPAHKKLPLKSALFSQLVQDAARPAVVAVGNRYENQLKALPPGATRQTF